MHLIINCHTLIAAGFNSILSIVLTGRTLSYCEQNYGDADALHLGVNWVHNVHEFNMMVLSAGLSAGKYHSVNT